MPDKVNVTMIGEKCALYENTILQGLDQFLVQDDGHQCYYPVGAFEPSVDKWVGVPVIYSTTATHPDLDLLYTDRQKALDEANARDVGMISSAQVVKQDTGKPHIKISMNVCDEEANNDFHDAKLGESSAFTCNSTILDDGTEVITGNIVPNHVLLFPRDPLSGVDQRDAAAMVNSILEVSKLADKINVGKELSGKNRGILQEIHDCLKNAKDKCASLLASADQKQSDDDVDDVPEGAEMNNTGKFPFVPQNPPGDKKSTAAWNKPSLSDFTDKDWSAIDDAEKTKIRGCFALVTDDTFGGCKLPHHEPSGAANADGVRNALSRASQTEGIGSLADKVKAHLEAHMKEFEDDKQNTITTVEGMELDSKVLEELTAKMNTFEASLKAKDEQIATLEKNNQEMAEKLNAVKAKEDAAKKQAFLNTLKPGVVKENGDALYAEFTADPVAFLNTHKLDLAVGGETKPEGAMVAKVLSDEEKANALKTNTMPRDKVLNYNPRLQKWELI